MRRQLASACSALLGRHSAPAFQQGAPPCLFLQNRWIATGDNPAEEFWKRYKHPDVYNPSEKMLVQMFGSAKEALGHYHTPVDWEVNRWQAFWERFGLWKHRFRAWRVCYRSITGFSTDKFLEEAKTLYKYISKAVAKRDIDRFKELIAPRQFQTMLEQSKKATIHSNLTVNWQLDNLQAEIVDGITNREIPDATWQQSNMSSLRVAQFTVRFTSQQRFSVTDHKGKVVAGDPNSTFECEEFWVFERAFYTGIIRRPGPEGSRWRLVETLNNEKVYNPPADYHERAAENIYDDTVMTTIKTIIPISIVLVGYLIMRHLGVA